MKYNYGFYLFNLIFIWNAIGAIKLTKHIANYFYFYSGICLIILYLGVSARKCIIIYYFEAYMIGVLCFVPNPTCQFSIMSFGF